MTFITSIYVRETERIITSIQR